LAGGAVVLGVAFLDPVAPFSVQNSLLVWEGYIDLEIELLGTG
jgi:hypothetical protein